MENQTDRQSTPTKNSSNDEATHVREVVASWLDKIERGEIGPWHERLTSDGRLDAFKWLIKKHGVLYAKCTLDNFEITRPEIQSPIIDRLRSFEKNMEAMLRGGGGLILIGTVGTGKDHLMFSLLRTAIIEYGFSVSWHDGVELACDVRRSISEDVEAQLRDSLERPQILAISDPIPPVGQATDWNLTFIRDIVDRRYRHGKSTWMTCNVADFDALKPLLTPPVADRMRDKSLIENLRWPSYRNPYRKVNC